MAKGRIDPVGRALWYIETHLAHDITLEEVAAVGGVSPYHLSRVFGSATGLTLMHYVRGRRLSEAARALAGGAPDILSVAIDAGYASHEAFTRAFRDRFGRTPQTVREQKYLTDIELTEALRMDTMPSIDIPPPRIEHIERLLIAGISERYSSDSIAGIPAQWQRFAPHIGSIATQVGYTTYGVCTNNDNTGQFDYICGVEVRGFEGIPSDWSCIRIEAQRYAVFLHRDHISAIKNTLVSIWRELLPASGHKAAEAPDFERYGEQFDPHTGLGGVEIWIPIES